MATAALPPIDTNSDFARRSEIVMSVALLAVIVMLLVPLPSMLLDMLLALNLGLTVLLLLVTLGAKRPLELSVFPSLLLLLTLYRLALNIATTRLILLDGDAGKIVTTFGGFVVGGSMIVGIVIFIILIVVQFVVITKGASRISEVNARFVLDAMPGKQMAIDAELTSNAIDQEEAKRRRALLTREAEFYGAMDGAGKYVRGDAIAGLIITGINIIGGIAIGLSKGETVSAALQKYTILTIGDGLVSQIPALIIATTSGILITKAATDASLGHELGTQMLANKRPLAIGAVIMLFIALTPGLPKLPFIALALAAFFFSRQVGKAEQAKTDPTTSTTKTAETPPAERPEEVGLNELAKNDRVCVEIGSGLFSLVSGGEADSISERITSLRRDLTRKFGFWVPTVLLRDNLRLNSNAYRILINGRIVAQGEIRPDQFLAIGSNNVTLELEGEDAVEPAFGLAAKWIGAASKRRATMGGYTVVDAPTVLVTHLGEILRKHAPELLSRQDLQRMLDKVAETSPTIVAELKPDTVRMATLRRVLCNLLAERVPIMPLELILESAVHHGPTCKDPDMLTDRVREDLGFVVCQRFLDSQNQVQVLVLDPKLDQYLRSQLSERKLVLQPHPLERLLRALQQQWESAQLQGRTVAVLTDFSLRRPLREAIERSLPDLAILAFTEIPVDLVINPVAIVQADGVMPNSELADNPGRKPATNAARTKELAA